MARNNRGNDAGEHTPRAVKRIGWAVILLLVLAIILLATGIVDMTPIPGP